MSTTSNRPLAALARHVVNNPGDERARATLAAAIQQRTFSIRWGPMPRWFVDRCPRPAGIGLAPPWECLALALDAFPCPPDCCGTLTFTDGTRAAVFRVMVPADPAIFAGLADHVGAVLVAFPNPRWMSAETLFLLFDGRQTDVTSNLPANAES